MSNKILDDDLFVVVNARRASVSFSPELEELPEFLLRNFSRNNLVVIYPEQFGDAPELDATMAAAMSADFTSTPISVWVKLRRLARRLMRH